MTVGIELSGTLSDGSLAAGWLARAQAWLHENWAHTLVGSEILTDAAGCPLLCFQLHPGAPDARIAACDRNTVRMSAETGSVGPGYHAHVGEVVAALDEELGMTWAAADEPTMTGGSAASDHVEREMLADLSARAGRLLAHVERDGWSGARLLLGGCHRYSLGEALATPLGPRDRSWLEGVSRDGALGRDIFSWWTPGLGARYRLGRALFEMWVNVRWRPPITAEEIALLQGVLALLDSAHASNPALDYPCREWREVLTLLGRDPNQAPRDGDDPGRPPIGYRRGNVRVTVGDGWSLVHPGAFADRWEDPATYTAWDGTRTIWLATSAGSPDVAAAGLRRRLNVALAPPIVGEVLVGEASPAGDPVHHVQARVEANGRSAMATIIVASPTDEAWALEVLRSLRCSDVPP